LKSPARAIRRKSIVSKPCEALGNTGTVISKLKNPRQDRHGEYAKLKGYASDNIIEKTKE